LTALQVGRIRDWLRRSERESSQAASVLLPDHVVTANNGATYFRLTGTSMSASWPCCWNASRHLQVCAEPDV
jgi:hypothetical protein